jgi:phage terminase large subunit-like protein
MVVSDGQENRAFDKKKSRGRIDGMVTIAMAVGAADNELGGQVFDLGDYLRDVVMHA